MLRLGAAPATSCEKSRRSMSLERQSVGSVMSLEAYRTRSHAPTLLTLHAPNAPRPMLHRIIDFSLRNKFVVLLATLGCVLGGIYAVRNIPLDAIPDLSDTQVIIYTEWPGQAPQIVQDQVTYPITTRMLSVPRAKVVRGYSFYGFSFAYVIFADGTDPYWARSRVLEYLSSLGSQLPKNVTPSLGPDATGVGWAFMYSINSTNRSLAERWRDILGQL